MKIRIKGDSIRFRLTKSEVDALCYGGSYKEETHIGENTFIYVVLRSQGPGMRAELSNNTITLHVDAQWLEGWDTNDQVGFEAIQHTEHQSSLHLLLEKDFVCLDRREEDQSDNYPNPKLQEDLP